MLSNEKTSLKHNLAEQKEENLIKLLCALNLFDADELEQIAQASKAGKNFPMPSWFDIKSIKSRASYFDCIKYFKDYSIWKESGEKGSEPKMPEAFENLVASVSDSSVVTPNSSQLTNALKNDVVKQAKQSMNIRNKTEVPTGNQKECKKNSKTAKYIYTLQMKKEEISYSVDSKCGQTASVSFHHKKTATPPAFNSIKSHNLFKSQNEILLPKGHPLSEAKKEINPKLVKTALTLRGYVRVSLTDQETKDIFEKHQNNKNFTILGLRK